MFIWITPNHYISAIIPACWKAGREESQEELLAKKVECKVAGSSLDFFFFFQFPFLALTLVRC